MRHTDFMRYIAHHIIEQLPVDLQRQAKLGEQRWLAQVYFGQDKRIHYEVSRPWSKRGRRLEWGLHLESRDKSLNRDLIERFDHHLLPLRATLGAEVWAEPWDKGWSKLYIAQADDDLTQNHAAQTTHRFAWFIAAVQPIYEQLRAP